MTDESGQMTVKCSHPHKMYAACISVNRYLPTINYSLQQ